MFPISYPHSHVYSLLSLQTVTVMDLTPMNGTANLKMGYSSGSELIPWALLKQSFLQLVTEKEVRDLKQRRIPRLVVGIER